MMLTCLKHIRVVGSVAKMSFILMASVMLLYQRGLETEVLDHKLISHKEQGVVTVFYSRTMTGEARLFIFPLSLMTVYSRV